jgi:hypothetical protein
MYDTLRREQCLSQAGIEERQHVIGLIEEGAAEWRHEQAQGMIGGTLAYHIAFILMRAGYLNARAGELLKTPAHPPRTKRWWKFWCSVLGGSTARSGPSEVPFRGKGRLLIVAVALTVLVSTALYISIRPSQGFGPALFVFLKPSETLLDQARQRLGKPWLEYDTYVFQGEIDPFVHKDEAEHYAWQLRQAKKTGRQLVKVYVLEYRNPAAMSENARLVFHNRTLLYALVPMSRLEATFERLRRRLSRRARVEEIPLRAFDMLYTARVTYYDEAGVGFLQMFFGPEEDEKIIYQPRTRRD